MARYDINPDDVWEVLTKPKKAAKNHYIADCPFCKKEQHLYYNWEKQVGDCKKCSETFSVFKLLKKIGREDLILFSRNIDIEKKLEIMHFRNLNLDIKNNSFQYTPLPDAYLPFGYRRVSDNLYLTNQRGFKKQDYETYEVGITELSQKHSNYIIFPVRQGGKVKGFTFRYAGSQVPKNKLRWSNSGHDFASLLYGIDDVDEDVSTVVVVEGILDKIAVDRALKVYKADSQIACVSSFGKKLSEQQQSLLLSHTNCLNIIFLYDLDAVNTTKKIAGDALKLFNVKCTAPTSKDPDEMEVDELIELIFSAESFVDFFYNKVTIRRLV